MAEFFTYWTDIAWRGWLHFLKYIGSYQTLVFTVGWAVLIGRSLFSSKRTDVDIMDLKSHALRDTDPKVIEMMEWFKEKQEEEKRKAS